MISPLIALMKDQVDFLQSKGIQAERLDSTLEWNTICDIYKRLRQNEIKLLLVAPERLSNERFINLIKSLKIDLMVIDEAHCISEWGHNFRPDYLKLARAVTSLKIPGVLALTATATVKVAADIRSRFRIDQDCYINTGFYRPNLTLKFTSCEFQEEVKAQMLLTSLKSQPAGPAIIYVTQQKTSEKVAEFLKNNGIPSHAYHAGLKSEKRNEIQDCYMKSDNTVIVATIAFGMGIDKSNIRYIYHFNLPKSLENYSQEIGRAGRDGLPSHCEVFVTSDDILKLENFVYGDTPDRTALSALIDYLLDQEDEFAVSIYRLSSKYDIRLLVISTLLTYLELSDVIESIAPYYDTYKFKLNMAWREITAAFDTDRSYFLNRLISKVRKAKIWHHADLDNIAKSIQEPRERLVKALDYLAEKGFITLNVTGLKHKYRLKNRHPDREELKKKLIGMFYNSESREIARVNNLISLTNYEGCKVSFLLEYFGETLDHNCGHCDWCLNREKGSLFERKVPEINDKNAFTNDLEIVKTLFESPPTPRQISRFLCGINSPFISKMKLKHHSLYGQYAYLPFKEILIKVESETKPSSGQSSVL